MPFTPYSQVVSAPNYVEPIPFSIYQQGQAQKSSDTKQAMSSLDNYVQQIQGIPAVGADAEVLQKKLEEVRQNLSKVALGSLATPQAQNQINTYLSQVSNDPDILAISNRGYSAQKMLRDKKDAEDKGKSYFNYGLTDLNNYIQNGVYKKDVRFNNQGGISPDEGEIMKEAKALVTPTEKRVYRSDGTYSIEKQYNPDELKQAVTQVAASKPNYHLFQQFKFDTAHQDTDWNQYAQEHFTPHIQTAQQNKELATHNLLLAKTPEQKSYYQSIIEDTDNDINTYSDLLNNPHTQQELKNKAYQDQLEQNLNSQVAAMDAVQQGDIKLDEKTQLGIQLTNSRDLELYKTQNDLFPYLSKTDQQKFIDGKDLNHLDWHTAGEKLLVNKQQNSLENQLIKAAELQKQHSKIEDDIKNNKVVDKYLDKNTTGADLSPSEEADVAAGERQIKDNLQQILPYIKSHIESDYRSKFDSKKFTGVTFDPSSKKYKLSSTDTFGGDFEIPQSAFNKAVQDWKQAKFPTSTADTYDYNGTDYTFNELIAAYGSEEKAKEAIKKYNITKK